MANDSIGPRARAQGPKALGQARGQRPGPRPWPEPRPGQGQASKSDNVPSPKHMFSKLNFLCKAQINWAPRGEGHKRSYWGVNKTPPQQKLHNNYLEKGERGKEKEKKIKKKEPRARAQSPGPKAQIQARAQGRSPRPWPEPRPGQGQASKYYILTFFIYNSIQYTVYNIRCALYSV